MGTVCSKKPVTEGCAAPKTPPAPPATSHAADQMRYKAPEYKIDINPIYNKHSKNRPLPEIPDIQYKYGPKDGNPYALPAKRRVAGRVPAALAIGTLSTLLGALALLNYQSEAPTISVTYRPTDDRSSMMQHQGETSAGSEKNKKTD